MESKSPVTEADIRLDAQARLEGRIKLLERTVNTMRDQMGKLEVDRNEAVRVVQQLRREIKELLHEKVEELWEKGGRKLRKDLEEKYDYRYELLHSRAELTDELERHNSKNTHECLHEMVKSIEEIKKSLNKSSPSPKTDPDRPVQDKQEFRNQLQLATVSHGEPTAIMGEFHPQGKEAHYRWFHELGMSREQMLDRLLKIGKIELLGRHVIWTEPTGARHDPKQHCKYHQAPGHSTNACLTLKNHIQALINESIITKQGNKWV